jgi:sterol 14-demethylase
MSAFCVKVDHGLCQGHAICATEAPEIFQIVDTDSAYPQARVLLERPPEALRKQAEKAARYCPNGAIAIIEIDD